MKVIYPGSFDPVTNGHLDIIERCSKKFERVTVAVLNNNAKNTLFTVEERKDMLKEVVRKYNNVEVDSFSGLLIDYAKEKGIFTVVRGLRVISDFEYEMQMSLINKKLCKDIETIMMVSDSRYSFLSSSVVKEIAEFGGDISCLVPKNVEKELVKKIKRR
ncbi:pantetheine-phosphate adenylyltransferase [Acidilutibacter cellobiosedens]|jgi:pantetheine-phosphate adenylyltransferase|uniref:Phosphopantetheine adenylyltransferase n=1 Tax=Acidilutibacter cellobiosedens TaxID=2507161 RepID=A0A410QC29_9FIRM|nr:pantetheine-phosphate adenylyltransferase [Acidilutibacter cellobiosedens]MBE6082450.1 pantetheine-phosphate adenylyltransferase [Tissierellaceae bacterium]QAT61566.1 pantetheine-phosphate adenylyltransferase [Acidilutibacter cellobiosedens]